VAETSERQLILVLVTSSKVGSTGKKKNVSRKNKEENKEDRNER